MGKDFEDLEIHYRGVHGRDLGDRYEKLGINPKNPSGPVFDDGLFKNVRAIGWVIDEYEKAQISINVTDFTRVQSGLSQRLPHRPGCPSSFGDRLGDVMSIRG